MSATSGSTDSSNFTHADVVVVGAGLGGLATAASLARAGRRVIVCERASTPGGRGRTQTREGFSLNLGAHALYRGGPASALLRELDVTPRGRQPSLQGVVVRDGHAHTLPATPLSILSTTAISLRSKLGLLRLFARLPRIDVSQLRATSCAQWLAQHVEDPQLRELMATNIRLATYCGELESLSADAAIEQLRGALAGVLYLDGGWSQLVDALLERCAAAGVELRLGARVTSIGPAENRSAARWAVQVNGDTLACDHIVIASSPRVADALLTPVLGERDFAAATTRCSAATLDLGLRGAWPGPRIALGLDQPIYLSVHSKVAKLAPPDHTLVSLIWYRRSDEPLSAGQLRERLERFARTWMPEFESALVVDQFLPDITVAHDIAQPERGGLPGRAATDLGDGLHLVGDWVGDRGALLDASLASAASVCAGILSERAPVRASA